MCAPRLPTPSTASRVTSSAVAHGGPIIDGTLGFRASIWYRYDGGWIDRVDPTTDQTTAHNVNYSHTTGAAPRRHLAAGQLLHGHAEHHVSEPSGARPVDLLAARTPIPAPGQFNTATPERIPDPDKYYLPALKLSTTSTRARSSPTRPTTTATSSPATRARSTTWASSRAWAGPTTRCRRRRLRGDRGSRQLPVVSAAQRQRHSSAGAASPTTRRPTS